MSHRICTSLLTSLLFLAGLMTSGCRRDEPSNSEMSPGLGCGCLYLSWSGGPCSEGPCFTRISIAVDYRLDETYVSYEGDRTGYCDITRAEAEEIRLLSEAVFQKFGRRFDGCSEEAAPELLQEFSGDFGKDIFIQGCDAAEVIALRDGYRALVLRYAGGH